VGTFAKATLLRDEESDRLAVECDHPAYRAALAELFFRVEGGYYVRSFPPNSVTEATYARFQATLQPLLRQTARVEPAPWSEALLEAIRRLDGAGVDWWLTGSAALAVRGISIAPRDLDLVVADADAPRVAAAFQDAVIEPPVAVQDWFCRWWGRAWLGARVEWVGGVTEAADEPEPTDFGLAAAAALTEVRWEGQSIRIPPLELQREVSVRRGLSDRVQLIDASLA
jgi:hypothetical protein